MKIHQYLARIAYPDEQMEASIESLKLLHSAHVLSIPFECLDIHLDTPISLNLEDLFEKVIIKERGGFCYELNFLFYNLLLELGYDCKIIAARIIKDNGTVGPEFDHMAVIVSFEDDWLVDVGYGDLFIEPIKISDGHTKKDWFRSYRIDQLEETRFMLSESSNGLEFKPRYEFSPKSRVVEEFYDQCFFKQSSKDSHFVKNKICTKPTLKGRATLLNDRLIIKRNQERAEYSVDSESAYRQILQDTFGIKLPD